MTYENNTLAEHLRDTIGGILLPSEKRDSEVVFRLEGIVDPSEKIGTEIRNFMSSQGYSLDESKLFGGESIFSYAFKLDQDTIEINYILSKNNRDLLVGMKL